MAFFDISVINRKFSILTYMLRTGILFSKALKDKLRQKFPGQVFDYSCQYDGIDESTGRPKVIFVWY